MSTPLPPNPVRGCLYIEGLYNPNLFFSPADSKRSKELESISGFGIGGAEKYRNISTRRIYTQATPHGVLTNRAAPMIITGEKDRCDAEVLCGHSH